ncbi:Ppx/GppA family phosphatase [Emcibacteraceae bacterium]|nr:Ppx/GppA family phosphatase [Emcibacteraceae bacterium]
MHNNKVNNSSAENNKTTNNGLGNSNRGSKNRKRKKNRSNVYGVVDLGTNNCRLLIAIAKGNGFKVIDSYSRIVRLGEGFQKQKSISEEAIERTISSLKICMDKMNRRGVTRMWNVATQACREAENSSEFLKIVEDNTKIKLDIIDSREEARLAVLSCKELLDTKYNKGIIFDIGGGSTEVIFVEFCKKKIPKIIDWVSLPLGVVNLSEQYGTKEALTEEKYIEIKNLVNEYLIPFEKKNLINDSIAENNVQLMGTSGTVTTLTSMFLKQTFYDRSKVDGTWMKSNDLVNLCNDLSTMDYTERLALRNLSNDRADLVVAGCAIFETIVDIWPIQDVRVADRGIREGMLHHLMDKQRRKNKANRRNKSIKRKNLDKNKKLINHIQQSSDD